MVRRSKRGAKSDPTGDDQSEKVNENSGEGEMVRSADEQNVTREPPASGDPPEEKVFKEVGEAEEVIVGQSEKETGENTEGLENGEGSGLKDEVMDHEVASAIAEAEKVLASECEAPPKEEAANESAGEEVVDISAEDLAESDEKERCLYCDDRGFSVNDVDAYVAHLETEHRVVRNVHLLARNTIDTHRQGMSSLLADQFHFIHLTCSLSC